MTRPASSAAVVAALAALSNALLLSPLPLEVRVGPALVLFVLLPGWLFVAAVLVGPEPAFLERGLLASGCGYTLAAVLMLGLYVLFRPLSTLQLIAAADLLNLGLLLLALARQADLRPRMTRPGWPLALLLALAAAPRLLNLGYSEFQGDEVKVVLRSFALLQGVPDALLAQRKPPAEVLIGAAFAGGLGGVTEAVGRLPFALAGAAAVLACYQLGSALFGKQAGLAAALLLAVNGYFVAFGRVLQYESLALLLDNLAILCLIRAGRDSGRQRAYAVVGGLVLAGAGLSALSAVFLLSLAVLALWPQLRAAVRGRWKQLLPWAWPLAGPR